MYDFSIDQGSKAGLYRDLTAALDALTGGEHDAVANMANAAALIWQYLPDLNWAGFYRLVAGELVVGPFLGRWGTACAARRRRRGKRNWSKTSKLSPGTSPATPPADRNWSCRSFTKPG